MTEQNKIDYWVDIADYDLKTAEAMLETELFDEFSENQKEFIRRLQPLNIEMRYPVYKENLPKFLTKEKC